MVLLGAGRAARAQSQGCFRAEIVPVTTTVRDDKGTETRIIVAQDEGIRPNTTMEGLAKLKPAFKDNGSTTAGTSGRREGVLLCPLTLRVPLPILACSGPLKPHPLCFAVGNSSQVSDGAAAILLARRSKAEELGLPILGVLKSYAVVGVPPDVMGIGPAYAIPVALKKAGEVAPGHAPSPSHLHP